MTSSVTARTRADVEAIREQLFTGYYDHTDAREPWTDFGQVVGIAESLLDVAEAARWYSECVEDGARTDCSWFALKQALAVLGSPDE